MLLELNNETEGGQTHSHLTFSSANYERFYSDNSTHFARGSGKILRKGGHFSETRSICFYVRVLTLVTLKTQTAFILRSIKIVMHLDWKAVTSKKSENPTTPQSSSYGKMLVLAWRHHLKTVQYISEECRLTMGSLLTTLNCYFISSSQYIEKTF